ncbi:uncharacterized protein LOC143285067 [Babylonia areolata]|uniref:uncharacterized protein LOC143285067 n=1 Tax=Babylonia areolata TaxID=304850 RepID=UPI003FD3FE47
MGSTLLSNVTVLSLLAMSALAFALVRKAYDTTNSDDVAALLKYYRETKCTSIGLGNNTYQQLLFYGKPLHVYAFGVQVCPDYMVYGHALCRCQLPGTNVDPVPDSPCTTVADLSYRRGKGVFTSATFVRQQGQQTAADLLALSAGSGQGGQPGVAALHLTGVPLVVDSFTDNQLVDPWSCAVKFRPDSESSRMVVLTDDCDTVQEKSLELTVTGDRLQVFLRFANDSVSLRGLSCAVQPVTTDPERWTTVEVDSVNSTVTVTVNGHFCVSTAPGTEAVLAQTRCPMYLGGSPKNSSIAFNGWVQYFKFKKGPKDECPL